MARTPPGDDEWWEAGTKPSVELTYLIVSEFDSEGYVTLVVPDNTRRALVQAGWIPPSGPEARAYFRPPSGKGQGVHATSAQTGEHDQR